MSWNPRRFAVLVGDKKLGDGGQRLLWVTESAQNRINSACDNDIIQMTAAPIPETGLIIGLARPLETSHGLVSIIWVAGSGDIEENYVVDAGDRGVDNSQARTIARQIVAAGVVPVWLFDRSGMSWLGTTFLHRNVNGPNRYLNFGGAQEPGKQEQGAELPHNDGTRVSDLVGGTWSLLNEPVEVEVTATQVRTETVSVGKKRKASDQDVSVIDVRMRRSSSEGVPDSLSSCVEHDYRWSVRGHWRNQPFGPGRAHRRRIWIESYVAGPEDKPMKSRIAVTVLR